MLILKYLGEMLTFLNLRVSYGNYYCLKYIHFIILVSKKALLLVLYAGK